MVCDGLKGLPEVVENVWPLTTVPTCIHLIRNTFRLTSRRDHDALKRDIKPVYAAVNADAARTTSPASGADTVLCSTNAIESLNARSKRQSRDLHL